MNRKYAGMGVVAGVVLLAGCAGSAAHKVVTANQAGDEALGCAAVDSEIVKTQVIIDGVNKDKDDINGADVVDGILWFPFNLIAKHQNYKDALEAADKRIANLKQMKADKGCSGSDAALQARASSTLTELETLARLHREGALSDSEYQDAKQKVLERM